MQFTLPEQINRFKHGLTQSVIVLMKLTKKLLKGGEGPHTIMLANHCGPFFF